MAIQYMTLYDITIYVRYSPFIDLSQTNIHTCSWSENSNNLHPGRTANNGVKLSWLLVAELQKESSGNLCATKTAEDTDFHTIFDQNQSYCFVDGTRKHIRLT